jgi:hypothetical protein
LRKSRHNSPNFSTFVAVLLAFLPFLGGCRSVSVKDPISGPSHEVSNVFRKEHLLPGPLKRVAVLPLSYKESSVAFVAGQQSLEPLFQSELTKASRFETVFIRPEQLKQWTGRDRFDAYESLPPNLFKLLAEKTGSDGILFANLSEYKAYPPMVIGWRMKLAANDADLLWAVEEIFDASSQPVSNGARRFERAHARNNPVLEDSRSILLSPTRFGQYTLDTLLATLPNR